jgi:hypothetical protein
MAQSFFDRDRTPAIRCQSGAFQRDRSGGSDVSRRDQRAYPAANLQRRDIHCAPGGLLPVAGCGEGECDSSSVLMKDAIVVLDEDDDPIPGLLLELVAPAPSPEARLR